MKSELPLDPGERGKSVSEVSEYHKPQHKINLLKGTCSSLSLANQCSEQPLTSAIQMSNKQLKGIVGTWFVSCANSQGINTPINGRFQTPKVISLTTELGKVP